MAAPVDDPVHVMPSRERLLSAVRRVATASAELLYAAQSSSTLAPADVSRIQVSPWLIVSVHEHGLKGPMCLCGRNRYKQNRW